MLIFERIADLDEVYKIGPLLPSEFLRSQSVTSNFKKLLVVYDDYGTRMKV